MKKINRILVALLACALMISMLAGCASKADEAEQGKTASTETAEPVAPAEDEKKADENVAFSSEKAGTPDIAENAPSFKLGFIHNSFSDQLGVMYQRYAQYAAEQLGCEIIFAEAPDDDSRTSAQQNMIEMGCNGLIMTTCSEAILQRCADAGVYFVQVGNNIADPALKEFADNCEYYIGSILVDNYQVGRNMVDALYAQGCRKLAFIEFTPGKVTTMDDRARGMDEAAEQYSDLEVVTVYTGMPNTFAEGAEQILAAYGDKIDGIVATMANAAIPSAIFSYGLSAQIKYAGVDIQEGTDELLAAGTMAYVAGGAFPNAELGVAMLYNYLSGYQIWSDKEDITRPLIELQSVEDYNNYMKFFEGDLPCYTGTELKTIVGVYTPDVTMDDVRALAADSSVASCVERHAGLID